MAKFSSAEVKAWHERMGLSTRWLADRWQTQEQSVQRWEHNRISTTNDGGGATVAGLLEKGSGR